MVGITILGKKCHANTRGTMFSLSSLVGSLGILFIQLVGGYLYSTKDSKGGPFVIAFASALGVLVVTVVVTARGRLRMKENN